MEERYTANVNLESLEIPYWEIKTRYFFREKDASDFHLEKDFPHHVGCWAVSQKDNHDLLVSFAFSNDQKRFFKSIIGFYAKQRISSLFDKLEAEENVKDNFSFKYKEGSLAPEEKVFCNLLTHSGKTYLTNVPFTLVVNYQDFILSMQYMSNIKIDDVIPIELMKLLDFRFVSKFMIEKFLSKFTLAHFGYIAKRLSEKE